MVSALLSGLLSLALMALAVVVVAVGLTLFSDRQSRHD